MSRDDFDAMLHKMNKLQTQIEEQNALISTLTTQKTAGPLKGRRALSMGKVTGAPVQPGNGGLVKPKAGRRAA